MQQLAGRSPPPSDVPAILKAVKLLSLQWLLPLSNGLLSRLPRLPRARNRQEKTAHDFILIISIKYPLWTDSSGHSMQLNTVGNDVKAILGLVDYQHDNSDGRCYYFLMDYDLEYTDSSGTTKLLPRTGLPTRELILETLEIVTMGGSSGLIHYSGHCHLEAPGTSEIEDKSDCIIYKETEDRPRGPKAAYLISCDGRRIEGQDFYRFLHNTSTNAGASTITLVLDTCKAEAFIKDFKNLRIIQDLGSVEVVSTAPTFSTVPSGQLIVITAARADEQAWTFGGCGILTYFLTQCLQQYPMASAVEVAQYLDASCQMQPDEKKRQHPHIWSRHPLNGPFRLTPRSALDLIEVSAPSGWHSWLEPWITAATQYAISVQAFRPMGLSHMVV